MKKKNYILGSGMTYGNIESNIDTQPNVQNIFAYHTKHI